MPAASLPLSCGAITRKPRRARICARPCRGCAAACRTRRGTAWPSRRHVAVRPDGLEVDVLRFERLVADGTPETLEGAVGLYRGPLLHDLDGCGEEFDDWLGTERRRLDEMLQQALQRLLEHYEVTGAIDRAIQVALRLLASDPMQESVHRSLIRLYMYQDRVGSALDQYRRCRELLARELGVEPAPETESLRAQLLQLVPAEPAGDQGLPGVSGMTCPSAPW